MKRLLIPLLALVESLREANPQAQFYIARLVLGSNTNLMGIARGAFLP